MHASPTALLPNSQPSFPQPWRALPRLCHPSNGQSLFPVLNTRWAFGTILNFDHKSRPCLTNKKNQATKKWAPPSQSHVLCITRIRGRSARAWRTSCKEERRVGWTCPRAQIRLPPGSSAATATHPGTAGLLGAAQSSQVQLLGSRATFRRLTKLFEVVPTQPCRVAFFAEGQEACFLPYFLLNRAFVSENLEFGIVSWWRILCILRGCNAVDWVRI